jgi:hypothetical protein
MDVKYPWFNCDGDVPHCIDYPEVTMYEKHMQMAARCPDAKQVERVDGVVV